jgi:hypothetical protein
MLAEKHFGMQKVWLLLLLMLLPYFSSPTDSYRHSLATTLTLIPPTQRCQAPDMPSVICGEDDLFSKCETQNVEDFLKVLRTIVGISIVKFPSKGNC